MEGQDLQRNLLLSSMRPMCSVKVVVVQYGKQSHKCGIGEMFKDNLPRTNVDEVKKLIDDRKMLVSSSAAG